LETVGAGMRVAFSGNDDAEYRDGVNNYDINIRLDVFDRQNVTDIANLSFVNATGDLIRLGQFAEIKQSSGPSKLERTDRLTSVNVNSFVVGRPSGSVGADIQQRLAAIDIPQEISISYEGDLKN